MINMYSITRRLESSIEPGPSLVQLNVGGPRPRGSASPFSLRFLFLFLLVCEFLFFSAQDFQDSVTHPYPKGSIFRF